MTGQVHFDSHTDYTVEAAIALVNAVTPGYERGRPFVPPTGDALVEATDQALAVTDWVGDMPPSVEAADRLAGWAGRLRGVIEQVAAGDVDAACRALNAIMRESGALPTLARHGDEPWHLHFHAEDAPWDCGWAAPMATALAVVLGNPAIDRLGVCTAPECDRVYIDTSRNGTRRFCSTACQNRVKAAAFRARQAHG